MRIGIEQPRKEPLLWCRWEMVMIPGEIFNKEKNNICISLKSVDGSGKQAAVSYESADLESTFRSLSVCVCVCRTAKKEM